MSTAFDPVLFDLDGTVIDSVALIRESHRHAVRTVLGIDLPDEQLVAMVGRPLIEQMREFSVPQAEELLRVYREWNHAHTAELLRGYDGIEPLLGALRVAGRRLGVVTSKSGPTVQLAFDVLPLARYFDVVVVAEDTSEHKPGAAPVLHALETLGAPVEGACYVGDAPFDILAAQASGVAAIGVSWGFFSRQALETLDPEHIADTPSQLGRFLGVG